ncbi:hypothetical protein PybrP1_004230, partial [[Pythium] brassicae (nom. inval.)]
MIFWVKYGFESTPVKMYNANVSSAILLSFLRNTCARDIDDVCKHKNIQLSIELDAVRKNLQTAHRNTVSAGASGALVTTRSTTSSAESLGSAGGGVSVRAALNASSRPPSGASRPTTPGVARASARGVAQHDEANEEVAAMVAQIELLEKQLELREELAAGVTRVDLVDQDGAQLHLDEAGATKASTLVTLRQQYSVVAI